MRVRVCASRFITSARDFFTKGWGRPVFLSLCQSRSAGNLFPASGAIPPDEKKGRAFAPPTSIFLVPACPLCHLYGCEDATTLFWTDRINAKQFYYFADQSAVPAECSFPFGYIKHCYLLR